MLRVFGKALRYGAVAVFAVLLVVCLALATPYGQRGALGIAIRMVSTPSASIQISGFQGSVFSTSTIGRITISDAHGIWLTVEELSLTWRPLALLGGTLDIKSLQIQRAKLARKPQLPANSKKASRGSNLPFGIRLGTAKIADFALGPDVFGAPAQLSLTTNLTLTGLREDIDGAVDVRRIDGREGMLAATVLRRAETGMIEFKAVFDEPAGGLMTTLLDSPGSPALKATLTAKGRPADLRADLAMESAGTTFTAASARLWQDRTNQKFTMDLSGYLAPVLPKRFRDIFAGRTEAQLRGSAFEDGGIKFGQVKVTTETMRINGQGLINIARNFAHGTVNGTLASPDQRALRLPFGGAGIVSVEDAKIDITLPEKITSRPVGMTAVLRGVHHSKYGKIAGIELTGNAQQPIPLDRDWRRLEKIRIEAKVAGVSAADPALQDMLTSDIDLRLRGNSDISSFTVDELTATSKSVGIRASGILEGGVWDGRGDITIADLAILSRLADRRLAGKATLNAKGQWQLKDDTAKVGLSATIDSPQVAQAQIDAMLAGSSALQATLIADGGGNFRIENGALNGAALSGDFDMKLSKGSPTGRFKMQLRELQRIYPELIGAVDVAGEFDARRNGMVAKIDASADDLIWQGKPARQVTLGMMASGSPEDISGTLKLAAEFEGRKANGRLQFARSKAVGVKIDDVDVHYGENMLRGWLQLGGPKGLDGDLVLDAHALQAFSGLLGRPISGKASARLTPVGNAKSRRLKFSAKIHDLKTDRITIPRATAEAILSDLLERPHGTAEVRIAKAHINGRDLTGLTIDVDGQSGAPAAFKLQGSSGPASFSASGSIVQRDHDVSVTLRRSYFKTPETTVNLIEPSVAVLRNGDVAIKQLRIAVGAGQVTLSAKFAKRLAVTANITKLPAALANTYAPALALAGEIDGQVSVAGTPAEPSVAYDLRWQGASNASTREARLSPLSIVAKGEFAKNVLGIKARATGNDALSASIIGSISVKPSTVLKLRATGQLPLKIVDVLLAARGTKGTGYLLGDVIITGPAKNPEFNGTATISGGGIRDVDSGLQLANLQLAARISGKEFIVDRLEAAAVPEGRVAASGRIGLDPAAGFPVNVDARADGVKLQDRKTIAGRFDSRVRITGGLDRGLMVAGSVSLQRFDIAIPERLPRSISDLNVTHVNVPPERRKELGLAVQPKDRSAMTPIRLDLDIRSDGRIFVRGRGLDAQLGGGIRLTGLTSQPIAEGAFRMVRGRMAIVGRRLAFNRGTIGFAGSLDPSLDFEATSDADGTVITTTVSGYASNPIIKFTSTPQLPEDELLARLLFNKSLAKLSPLQIAQLASEVDRLGGISGGSGVLEQLRKSVGVDSLDVSSDKKGNTAITAGKYVTQGTYVGVQQNTGTNASRVIIDLDITKNIKARGETGSDGKSKVGVGIEWNY